LKTNQELDMEIKAFFAEHKNSVEKFFS